MITHRFPFEQAPQALERLDRGERSAKIVITGV
jgi:threonine dehydrogenase-like Zn-dependent dehydrogenase